MFLDKWTIVKCPKCNHVYAYYTPSYISKSRFKQLELLCPKCKTQYEIADESDMNADLVEMIMREEIVHRNISFTVIVPRQLHLILKGCGIPEDKCTEILKKFCESIFD